MQGTVGTAARPGTAAAVASDGPGVLVHPPPAPVPQPPPSPTLQLAASQSSTWLSPGSWQHCVSKRTEQVATDEPDASTGRGAMSVTGHTPRCPSDSAALLGVCVPRFCQAYVLLPAPHTQCSDPLASWPLGR